MNGLFRRGGVWWARLVVPERLRVLAGRREFAKSTGSHDNAVGKLVAAVLLADWRRQLFELEGGRLDDTKLLKLLDGAPALAAGGFVSLGQAADMLGSAVSDLLRAASVGRLTLCCAVGRGTSAGYLLPEAALMPIDPEVGRGGYLEVPAAQDMPPEAVATDVLGQTLRLCDGRETAGAILADELAIVELLALEAPGRSGWLFVPNKMIQVELEALQVPSNEVEALRVVSVATVSPERIERARASRMMKVAGDAVTIGKWATKRFSEAVSEYVTRSDGLPGAVTSLHEIRQTKNGLLLFSEFMGDLRLSEIDGDKLREFRDGPLKEFPHHLNRMKKAERRDTMRETVAALKAGCVAYKLMSQAQQRERMLKLFRLFGWLRAKTHLTVDPSVALRDETGMTKAESITADRDVDDEEGRRPFTSEELHLIFGQRHYQTGNGSHVTKGNQKWRPFEFWLPLLGLFGGLRIGEASQLHLNDVVQIDGQWCLDINRRTADKSLKNKTSVRVVPIHTRLIELGFVEYCEQLRLKKFQRIFPELGYASVARYGKESGRKMSEMLKKLGMPRDGTLVYHCLRHCLNNALARVPESAFTSPDPKLRVYVRYHVVGHKLPEDVNGEHYMATTAAELARLVNGVVYDLPEIARFDVEHGISRVESALQTKPGDRRGKEDMGPLTTG